MISTILSTHSPSVPQFTFPRRSIMPLRQNELWKIEIGVVRALTWSDDGTLIPLGLWGPDDIVGKELSKADPYKIECLTQVQAQLLRMEKLPEIAPALIRHSQQLEEFLVLRQYKPIEVSLLRFLNWLSKRFGREVERGQLIDLRLTHQEIAEIIGSNRVTVTRLLKSFEDRGIICRDRRSFVLVSDGQPFWHYEI